MASANVRLMKGRSYRGRGYTFTHNGEIRTLTNAADILFFENNSRFQVKRMEGTVASASPEAKKPPAKKPPAKKPEPEDGEDEGEADGGEDTEGEAQGPLPWKQGQKKALLIAAAESRGIAVTADDTAAAIVQLLKEWDEDNGSR